MLPKKFYLPIGILILVICAVGLLSLRPDVPDEPIVIYKTTTPIKRSVSPTTPPAETRTISASMPIESVEETPVSTSEVPMSYLLSEFPDYESMNSVGQEVARGIAKLRWEGEKGERLVFLKRFLEHDNLRVEMAGHVLGSPAMKAEIPPDALEYLAMPSIRNGINPKWRTYIELGGTRFE